MSLKNSWFKIRYFIVLLLPCVGIVLGVLMLFNVFVPAYVVQRTSFFGTPENSNLGTVIFTIKSKGTFTANYPIDVEIVIMVGAGIENYFQPPSKIDVLITDSYKFPIVESTIGGAFATGDIPISAEDRNGAGKIIFPYSGSFSDFNIFLDNKPVFFAQNGPPIFVIEDYGLRLQIENANRSIGIAIVSLSFTVIGLILALIKKTGSSPNN